MREIHYNDLIPGTTYVIYIPYYSGPAAVGRKFSGKRMGTFVELEQRDRNGPIFAKFENLQSLPGATLETGLGTKTTQSYNVKGTTFYLLENEEMLTDQVLRSRTNMQIEPEMNYNLGGKKRKTRNR